MASIYRFAVKNTTALDFASYESIPVYTINFELVGSLLYDNYDRLQGFIAGTGYPMALSVSSGEPFFVTPVEKPRGVSHAFITDRPIGVNSITVTKAERDEELSHEKS